MRAIKIIGGITVFVFVLFLIVVKVGLQSHNNRLQYNGYVHDKEKKPIRDVIVSVSFVDGSKIEIQTDSRGYYQITSPLGATAREISAKKPGWLFIYQGNLDPYIPGVLEGGGLFLAFPEHGETIQFDNKEKHFVIFKDKAITLGNNRFYFIPEFQGEKQWSLSVQMENGRVTKTLDSFPSTAPDDEHYLESITYHATQPDNPYDKEALIYYKKDNIFGWVKFEYYPYASNGSAILVANFGENLSGGKLLLHSTIGKK